eukprot:1271812-Alexandrium_andersonii.AAC.2
MATDPKRPTLARAHWQHVLWAGGLPAEGLEALTVRAHCMLAVRPDLEALGPIQVVELREELVRHLGLLVRIEEPRVVVHVFDG